MFLHEPNSVEAREYLDKEKSATGFVMDLERGWAWRPDVAEAFANLRKQLSDGSTLSLRERAVLVCAKRRRWVTPTARPCGARGSRNWPALQRLGTCCAGTIRRRQHARPR